MELTEKQKVSARNVLLRAINAYEDELDALAEDGSDDAKTELKKVKFARQYLKDLKEHGE